MALNFTMSDLEYFSADEWFTYADNTNSYTDLGLIVGRVQKPIMPQVQESVQQVPGMYGNYFAGNSYGEMTFTIPVTLKAFDATSYNIIVNNMRAMFTADAADPGIEYPIVFGDAPNVKWYGHWGQMSPPTFITPTGWEARATLTFIVSQPYGYLPQEEIKLTHPNQTITPGGTGKTYPVYKVYLKQDVYGLGFSNSAANDEYVATGYTVDDNNTDEEGLRINDDMPLDEEKIHTNLSDWITGKTNIQNIMGFTLDGDQAGQMGEADGGGITPAYTTHIDKNRKVDQKQQVRNYGNPKAHSNFYGPLAISHQFNNPTPDWRIMVNLWNQKSNATHTDDRAMGHCEIYLLDWQGNRHGRIWIHDWQKGEMPRVGFCLGPDSKHEIDMVNVNDWDQDTNDGGSGAAGPWKIGNDFAQVNRPTNPAGYEITSLKEYKQYDAVTKKTKAAAKQAQRLQTSKRKSRRKRKKQVTSAARKRQQAASEKKHGNRRHERHHYKRGRKGR